MNMIYMLLPGTPITYYGEEIGMQDGQVRQSFHLNAIEIIRIFSPQITPAPSDERANYRTPMQWNSNANAGFTGAASPWLPVNGDYATLNVDKQQKAESSHLKVYKALAEKRHERAVLFGELDMMANGTVFAYNRVKKGSPGILVAANLGSEAVTADLSNLMK